MELALLKFVFGTGFGEPASEVGGVFQSKSLGLRV
jgi:hypothetical protein